MLIFDVIPDRNVLHVRLFSGIVYMDSLPYIVCMIKYEKPPENEIKAALGNML